MIFFGVFAGSIQAADFSKENSKQSRPPAFSEIVISFHDAKRTKLYETTHAVPADRRIAVSVSDQRTMFACLTPRFLTTWKAGSAGKNLIEVSRFPQLTVEFNYESNHYLAKGNDPVMCFNVSKSNLLNLHLARRDAVKSQIIGLSISNKFGPRGPIPIQAMFLEDRSDSLTRCEGNCESDDFK